MDIVCFFGCFFLSFSSCCSACLVARFLDAFGLLTYIYLSYTSFLNLFKVKKDQYNYCCRLQQVLHGKLNSGT